MLNRRNCLLCSLIVFVLLFFPAGCIDSKSGSKSEFSEGQIVANRETTLRGREKGIKEATEAIAQEILMLKEYPPLPYPPGHNIYTKLLRDRCKVVYVVLDQNPAGVSEDDFRQEVNGWNSTMELEIKRRFGSDIFDQLHSEAQRLR
jgi:hypothetical protein